MMMSSNISVIGILLLALSPVVLSGCYTGAYCESSLRKQFDEDIIQWKGQPYTIWIEQVGPPDNIKQDGLGGQIFVYNYAPSAGPRPGYTSQFGGTYVYMPPSSGRDVLWMLIFVNKDDKIYGGRLVRSPTMP